MGKRPKVAIGLRGLFLIFVLLAVLGTLCNSLIVAYTVQRDALIHSALEANRAYAFKVASSIDQFLHSVNERLKYSSQLLGSDIANPTLSENEARRLQAQDSELSAVLITDSAGRILQAYPTTTGIGLTVTSDELNEALKLRRPMVSQAFTSTSGKLIAFVSQPIFSPTGEYLGLVGGSLHLQQNGVMHSLIGEHHLDGTFAFVADGNRRLLYHPDQQRIGERLDWSKTVDQALLGQDGAMETVNYHGVPMLAGYAHVQGSNWAVVVQQPREQALAPLGRLMRDMLIKIIPAGVVGLGLILLGVMLITRPLRALAGHAIDLSAPNATAELSAINAWYTEAAAIRQALVRQSQHLQQKIGTLNAAADTDLLTGLANRRAMNAALERLDAAQQPYSALALDIDYFKRVNDTFGHDVGDVALQHVAQIIRDCARTGDLACRAGGEEFCLLLPDTDPETAHRVAERIRSTLSNTSIAPVGTLTLSIGVACRDVDTPSAEAILKRADERLYLAKRNGRNCVVVWGSGL
ncbi:sensor domain-containing diguanylate cyclase [Pseudomonas sp.]|jgi:diguanylate cyclase (GGDEF)-like protein|uniref:sensor domain-containing diguanylate cyclase n=1 Tax=Pseudomonas sp. TaxID=306 RepID=UPI002E314F9B|nr:sensor domain-containing diguanylate cyclase [Pseudomonas sp.]HEX4549811.1 sensor domain-containing diguanylate cyclase [Pseudomonas sp.]